MRQLTYMIAFTLMLVGPGCNGKSHDPKLVARVNGIELTVDDVSFRRADPHVKAQEEYGPRNVEDIINEELLCQKAVQLGLDVDDTYGVKKSALDQMSPEERRRELAKRVFNTQIAARIDVTHRDARSYYDDHRREIETELHLQLLTFEKKSVAESALAKVRAGASFSSVALEYGALGPEHGNSPWDLGFLRWEEIPIDFADAIYRLKPGEISGLLGNHRTRYQIVKLLETRKGTHRDYTNVSASVMNRLRDQRLLEAYLRYVSDLRKQARIETF